MATGAEVNNSLSAPLARRVVAYAIDMMALHFVLGDVLRYIDNWGFADGPALYVAIGLFNPPVYFIIWEGRTGTTPGKLLLGLKVASVVGDGGEPSVGQVLRRRAPLLLGLVGMVVITTWSYFVVTLALFFTVFIPDDRRGLHDRLSGTMVVRCRPRGSAARSAGPTPPVL